MNAPENVLLKRNLTALVEFSRIINSSLDLKFILSNMLLTCMGKFFATKGIVILNIEGELLPLSFKGIPEEKLKKFPEMKAAINFSGDEKLRVYLNSLGICIIEEICSSNECIGILGLGEKLNKTKYSGEDIEFLKTIVNISSTAIQNSIVLNELTKVNRVLDSRIHRLTALFELSKEFGLFSESSRVAKLLIYSVIGQFLISKFAVVTFDENKNPQILESKFPENRLLSALLNYDFLKMDSSIKGEVFQKEFSELAKLSVELIVPMQLQGETKGLILLGKRVNEEDYSEADLEFIYSVGSLAIISIENKRLFNEALEKQKLEEELEIARDIQKNLFPQSIPEYSNFEIAAANYSSRQVGGDYYDIIKLDNDTFCIAIGDVSGKGVGAALLMANLQAFLKTTCRQGMQIDEATAIINDLVSENTSDGKFITFFWGIIENENKMLSYVNAGHNPPLLIRDGKITKLEKGGIILGVMKTMFPYISEKIQLKKDDVLILFTDGVSEAMNRKGEEFSDVKLESLALKLSGKTAKEILSEIKTDVQNFSAGAAQSDDITLMIIKVK
jgi:sigma-B regulation protein RsbU (phosphoserine phosphatase)